MVSDSNPIDPKKNITEKDEVRQREKEADRGRERQGETEREKTNIQKGWRGARRMSGVACATQSYFPQD